MSDLIAVAYPDRDTAEAVRRTLGQLSLQTSLDEASETRLREALEAPQAADVKS
jgi:uncharacterized membrane protein